MKNPAISICIPTYNRASLLEVGLKSIISQFKTPSIYQRVEIIISDEECIHGATALYCACYRGHFTVAKTLIELGRANVNQDTHDYPNYPLLINATIITKKTNNPIPIIRITLINP